MGSGLQSGAQKAAGLFLVGMTLFFTVATSPAPDDGDLTPIFPPDGGSNGAGSNDGGSNDPGPTDAGPGAPPGPSHVVMACADLLEENDQASVEGISDDGSLVDVQWQVDPDVAAVGTGFHRVYSQGGTLSGLRVFAADYGRFALGDLSRIQMAIRAENNNQPAWQGDFPWVRLTDQDGEQLLLQPEVNLLGTGLGGFVRVSLNLPEGDALFDRQAVRGIEILADTWGAGFVLDVDGLAFSSPDTQCPMACPEDCHGQGTCDADTLECSCALGSGGLDCGTCLEGYRWGDAGGPESSEAGCVLETDGIFDHWPNPISAKNSDPWLMVHAQELRRLSPRVLVLQFDNSLDGDGAQTLVDSVRHAFAEASRSRPWEDSLSAPQLTYELARPIVDLRDGAEGRPPPPAHWSLPNSTLMPRRAPGDIGAWRFDYADLFGDAFAAHYGFADPESPDKHLGLCGLVERGLVHEVWLIAEGAQGEANMAEVLEMKQRYDPVGNGIEGSMDRCAGNGCFDVDVPLCGRSLRILTINSIRGPGCAMHSTSHGVESFGSRGVVPALSEWFRPFAGFDLSDRYGAPVNSFYELGCGDADVEGLGPRCITYHSADQATFHHGDQPDFLVGDYDGRCGNVHFPPNAERHYDDVNPQGVASSCMDFGRGGQVGMIDASAWSHLNEIGWDCGGGFLIWWYQNMPAGGSNQRHDDGRAMHPIWPAFFH
jgi:hypothetical protein